MPDDRHLLGSKPEEGQAQLTVRLPATLHRQFKTLAAMEGQSMADLVVGWIREHVQRSKPEDFIFEPPRVKQIDDPHSRREKVELIMDLRRDGLSFGAIANEMNERGILNLKSKPEWSKGAVYRLVMENAKKFGQLKMGEAGQQKTAKPYQPKLKDEMEHLFDFEEDEDEHDHEQEEKNDE